MDKIYFTVNGEHYSVSGSEVSPSTTLNDYLRNTLQLFATKAMCHEGGCGICVVGVSHTHPLTKEKQIFSVNSCLVHILSCHQWDITTVEGVGNRKEGYHPLQLQLAKFNGTQCGYCTPGWIMSMYSLYEGSNRKLTLEQIEKSFGGNMCRCTGYRPILDAFKTFAVDAEEGQKIMDLEDLNKMQCIKDKRRCSTVDEEWCVIESKGGGLMEIQVKGSGGRWYKASTIEDVFKIWAKEGTDSYALVAGNTGRGVYYPQEKKVYIDISSVETLKESLQDENLVIGAGMTITEVMDLFKKWSESNEDFKYLKEFYDHLDLVAHVPVRNIGTIGGNLAMKNAHPEFVSDIFLLLGTVGSTITILDKNMEKKQVTVEQFMKEDLRGRLIINAKVPPLSPSYLIRTYKVMPRNQNAHAIVNSGFAFKIDAKNRIDECCVIIGAIGPNFIKASLTENVLKGADLFRNETLQKALDTLKNELVPADIPPEPSAFCRKTLAVNLLYKAILSLCPDVNPRFKSGGTLLKRGVSKATQTYDTDKIIWPLNEPVSKLEALTQCSGEANFVSDCHSSPREVHVAFVLSTICTGEIISIDASEALKLPGVIAFYTAKDIPGKNTFTPLDVSWQDSEEEILASKTISYNGQPIGLIAAVTWKLAIKAALKVKVEYKKSDNRPVLSIRDAMVAPDKERRFRQETTIKPSNRGTDIHHVIKGDYSMGSQYHYTMETQSCKVSNTDQGLTVRSSTQWMDLVQIAVAKMLALPVNKVEVVVPRVGGGYGGKASRAALAGCACALVARLLHRDASLVLPLFTNMKAVGKRMACYADYEMGINATGVIQYLDIKIYSDCGYTFNDSAAPNIASTLTNLYSSDTWSVDAYSVLTDGPSHTWCRAPSTTEATAIIEHLMERIAFTTKRDPTEIRFANLDPKHSEIKDIILSFKKDCLFDERLNAINKFNSDNAWRKKALSLSIMSFPIEYGGSYPVMVSVYHGDGTVVLSHGGIEMGQGINTKAAQVCAYTLKIPLDKVSVKSTDTFTSPNAIASSGSITSECVAFAIVKACEKLLKRLEEVKQEMTEPTWEELVKKAFEKGVHLQTSYMWSENDSLKEYTVYGACATEVELDVLCGTHIVTRVDLLEDTGVSLSPGVDVGQIEGAYIMGLGLWTMEHLKYSQDTGGLLTASTWTYKICGARDIPEDFRVSFRRNSYNPAGVLRSKATGEPALVLAVGVTHALRHTICEARKEYGYNDTDWLHIDTPYNIENILKAIAPKSEAYKLI